MKRKIVQVLHLNNSSPPWWRDFTWEACWHFEVGLIRTRPGAVVDDLRLGGGKMLILSGKQTTTWCPNVEPIRQCQGTSGVWQERVRELRRWRRTLSPSQSLDPQNQLRRGHWGEQLCLLFCDIYDDCWCWKCNPNPRIRLSVRVRHQKTPSNTLSTG